MIFIIPISILSIFLEGFITNFVAFDTNLFNNCFSLISLIIIFPYFYNNRKLYFIISFIIGLIIDIAYTDTLFLNAFIYLFIAYIITKLSMLILSNFFNNIFLTLLIIIIYRVTTYFLLVITGYLSFEFDSLLNSILSSIILNVIYVIILSILSNIVSRKLRIIKID